METLILVVGIIQSFGISLGVGASTMAVLNFFTAISDGKIDETERSFMGITYVVLRISMVTILFTTTILAYNGFNAEGVGYFSPYVLSLIILMTILYINAVLMTLHIMPSTFGPAIQASTWYTLGLLLAFKTNAVADLGIVTYMLIYLAIFLVGLALINGTMSYLKSRKT